MLGRLEHLYRNLQQGSACNPNEIEIKHRSNDNVSVARLHHLYRNLQCVGVVALQHSAGRQAGRQAGAKLVLQRPSAQQAKRILLCLPSSQGHLCHYACPLRSWHRRPVAGIQHLCSGGGTERRRGIVSPLLPNF